MLSKWTMGKMKVICTDQKWQTTFKHRLLKYFQQFISMLMLIDVEHLFTLSDILSHWFIVGITSIIFSLTKFPIYAIYTVFFSRTPTIYWTRILFVWQEFIIYYCPCLIGIWIAAGWLSYEFIWLIIFIYY